MPTRIPVQGLSSTNTFPQGGITLFRSVLLIEELRTVSDFPFFSLLLLVWFVAFTNISDLVAEAS